MFIYYACTQGYTYIHYMYAFVLCMYITHRHYRPFYMFCFSSQPITLPRGPSATLGPGGRHLWHEMGNEFLLHIHVML